PPIECQPMIISGLNGGGRIVSWVHAPTGRWVSDEPRLTRSPSAGRPIYVLGHATVLPPKLTDQCETEKHTMRQMSTSLAALERGAVAQFLFPYGRQLLMFGGSS